MARAARVIDVRATSLPRPAPSLRHLASFLVCALPRTHPRASRRQPIREHLTKIKEEKKDAATAARLRLADFRLAKKAAERDGEPM